ncbi:MAG: hypothetical protein QOG03_1823 [Actinomycetota bacterium]|jgi:predicted amino acid-binding ACT domain protein|nr:hypothetical protein [Actinomycetota bacterium]
MRAMATTTEVKALLGGTSLPPELVDELLDGATATWLMGERADTVAADLVLCHPRLALAEVRAQVFPSSDGGWRLAVATRDRPGLLAAIAGVLATHRLSITTGSGTAWPAHDVALMRVTAHPRDDSHGAGPEGQPDDIDWDAIGDDLRSVIAEGRRVAPTFLHVPDAVIEVMPAGDRTLVTVTCPDRVGLLWAITSWFEDNDCNIEEASVTSDGEKGVGHFVVTGTVDPGSLTTALTGAAAEPILLASGKWIVRGIGVGLGITWGIVRALRKRALG